ncbi:MAG: hypothetical protein A3A51_03725 [Candidatus Levybacteria bacterium RIFCSPLOWO2_01_FULL_39_10]|nr:MAG: hypothetical protein A3A51_03725 [Candidatus Levybacteria bacterium RIFCSPLOWO2_01_FULL_39_10]
MASQPASQAERGGPGKAMQAGLSSIKKLAFPKFFPYAKIVMRKLFVLFITLVLFLAPLLLQSLVKNAFAQSLPKCPVSAYNAGTNTPAGTNQEFIDLRINTGGVAPDLRTGARYNVKILGSNTGDGFVRTTNPGSKFEFVVNEPVNLNGNQVVLMNSNGVINIPSVNFKNEVNLNPVGIWEAKEYTVQVLPHTPLGGVGPFCESAFQITEGSSFTSEPLSRPCNDSNWSDQEGCQKIETAIGPISTDPNDFVRWILGFVLGISGGILILLLIVNGYKLMTSQGDPEKTKDARDGIIAAIAGLLLVIFSIVLLQLITVNVLGLPGFG